MADLSYGPEVGYVRLTSSGVVGDANKPIAMYGVIFKSSSTAGNPTFSNGNSVTNTAVFDLNGTISTTTIAPLSGAIVFPLGLYVTVDANTTYVLVYYRQVLS